MTLSLRGHFQNIGREKWQKAKLMYFQTRLLILMDLQYLPLNIEFKIYTSKYMFLGYAILPD